MAEVRSLFDQVSQIRASTSHAAVSSVHTEGVAQGQTTLEGDLNVLRTLVKDLHGKTNWYDLAAMKLSDVAGKYFLNVEHAAAFDNVATGTGLTSIAFDTGIKGITGHAGGVGSSTVTGIVLNATLAHHLEIRDHDTQDSIDDGSGNAVYGKLSHATTIVEAGDADNELSGYAAITGVTDANTGPGKKLWIEVVDDTAGYFHLDVWKNAAKDEKVAHTATYNSTGAKALVADNTSGLGGTITVDAVGPADADITIRFGTYTATWYSMKAGTETAYSFATSVDVDLAAVIMSRTFQDLPWERFLDLAFHDVSGVVGSVSDNAVTVADMAYMLVGLTTQHQVNVKVDKLGHIGTDAEGAHLVAIDDTSSGSSGYWTGDYVQEILNEIKTQIGGATSGTYNFTGGTGTRLADNDAVYAALNKLDQSWVALKGTADTGGAILVGIHDEGGYTSQVDVEGALQEIYGKIVAVEPTKEPITTTGVINADTDYVLPNSLSYTNDGKGANLDVYYQGQLLTMAATGDYSEVAGAPATKIQFHFTVPTGRNLIFVARK